MIDVSNFGFIKFLRQIYYHQKESLKKNRSLPTTNVT